MSAEDEHRGIARIAPLTWLLSLPIVGYRRVISPMKPRTCRFDPTCSAYALEALRVHGAIRGSWLTFRRLLRCHPYCESGHDPVPPRSGARRPLLEQRR